MATSSAGWAEIAAQDSGNNTWTSLANAQGSTTTGYAVWTNATSGNTGRLLLSHFWAQGNMIGGQQPVSITNVILDIWSYVSSTTNISALSVQLIGSVSGALGSPTTVTRSTTSTNSQTITISTNLPTWDDLADLQVRLIATHAANSNSATYRVGAVRMKITYVPMVALNKARAIKDAFTSGADVMQWFAWPNWPASDGAGGLKFVPSTVDPGTWQYLTALEPVDLRESSVSLKLVRNSTTVKVWWGLSTFTFPWPPGGGDAWFRQIWITTLDGAGANIDFGYTENWQDSVVASTAYNASTMAYQRIRHSGSTVYFDTSADAVTWTNRTSYAESLTPHELTYMHVFVRTPNLAGGTAWTILDDLNTNDAEEARKYGAVASALAGGSGTWVDEGCGTDDDNDTYATWAVP